MTMQEILSNDAMFYPQNMKMDNLTIGSNIYVSSNLLYVYLMTLFIEVTADGKQLVQPIVLGIVGSRQRTKTESSVLQSLETKKSIE